MENLSQKLYVLAATAALSFVLAAVSTGLTMAALFSEASVHPESFAVVFAVLWAVGFAALLFLYGLG